MSTTTNDEISLKDFSNFFNNTFKKFTSFLFNVFNFFYKNKFIIIALFIIGVVLGYFSDKNKKYAQEIIVIPNFSSVDYLYDKIEGFNSKIIEKDSLFLKKYNLKGFKKIKKITIEPIIDIYKLGQSSNANLEMIKLMTEDISMDEIIKGDMNKKAYFYHQIVMKTDKKVKYDEVIKPFMDYLNDSDYFKEMQKVAIDNTKYRLANNDSTLVQINGILSGFSQLTNGTQSKDKLIYYNENTQINDILQTKEKLSYDRGVLNSSLINIDKVVKDVGIIENKILKKSIPDKIVYPIILILLFTVINLSWKSFKFFKKI